MRADVGCVALQRGPLVYCLEKRITARVSRICVCRAPTRLTMLDAGSLAAWARSPGKRCGADRRSGAAALRARCRP
ncbi:hypothetical protein [Candidatus Flexifilum breve]|uniref:hypothetical protein n=1 Tax=Candidatus Flexifilum breve TaxID=3140694 RepID=UPI003312FD8B